MQANELFIELIREKFPQNAKLTNFLSDLLIIEKEAVYRRLRGEVPFTFSEALKISKQLNISLDMIEGNTSLKSRPFQMKMIEYENPTDTDFFMLNEYVDLIESVKDSSYSEFGSVTSVIPSHFYSKYDLLYRLYLMKWIYQFGDPSSKKKYHDIHLSDKLKQINRRFVKEVQNIDYTYFVIDELLMHYVANDIQYFKDIKLISPEEVKLLKDDLYSILKDMDRLTSKGTYENGNKLHIHISTLHFESNYSYLQKDNMCITMMKTYTLNEIASLDLTVFNKMKVWINSLKRPSILISGSGEIERIKFFERQMSFLEEL